MLDHLKCMKRMQSRTLIARRELRLFRSKSAAYALQLTLHIPCLTRSPRPATMTPHEHGADDEHECPAEQVGSDARSSEDTDDCEPRDHRPSTAPQPDVSATQTWGRIGFLTAAQQAHLASMRRKFPAAGDAEARNARGCFANAR